MEYTRSEKMEQESDQRDSQPDHGPDSLMIAIPAGEIEMRDDRKKNTMEGWHQAVSPCEIPGYHRAI